MSTRNKLKKKKSKKRTFYDRLINPGINLVYNDKPTLSHPPCLTFSLGKPSLSAKTYFMDPGSEVHNRGSELY